MPKRGAVALGLTALALVLLLNFRTPSEIAAVATTDRPGVTGTSSTTGTRGSTGSTGSAGGTAQAGSRTLAGPVVNTRFGPVQVQITVDAGKVTDVAALQLPSGDRRSANISSRVEQTLRSQALTAQSASIDGVSGATYTSVAYARSLQAALDTAGI
jgi:uncharacterized protein with FMN-binding domain